MFRRKKDAEELSCGFEGNTINITKKEGIWLSGFLLFLFLGHGVPHGYFTDYFTIISSVNIQPPNSFPA